MILHIDMDAFYASIEQRDCPELRGKPVIVGGGSKRGVVAAASYEARSYGIHSAMSGKRAAELCPHAVFVKSRLEHYAKVGHQVRDIFHQFTPVVQPLSLDEAFLDVSGTTRLFGTPADIGRAIKESIKKEIGLNSSVGIAPLKFVAKIASDLDKPDGFLEVAESHVLSFLDPLCVSRLWGVGKVGNTKLASLQLKTIGDIRRYDRKAMNEKFGNWGDHLWKLANGIDPRKVIPDRVAKQISHERTFQDDMDDFNSMRAVISHLCEQVARRLRRNRRFAKSVSVKYRCSDFRTFAQTHSFHDPVQSTDQIFQTALDLLDELIEKHAPPIRLLGVSLGNLTHNSTRQLELFTEQSDQTQQSALDDVVDAVSDRLGGSSVYRASSHSWIRRKQ